MNRKLLLGTFSLALVLALSILFAERSASADDRSVDPSTLNPPPPPQFNPVCERVGGGTICTVQFSDPPFAGGIGIVCGTGANSSRFFNFKIGRLLENATTTRTAI